MSRVVARQAVEVVLAAACRRQIVGGGLEGAGRVVEDLVEALAFEYLAQAEDLLLELAHQLAVGVLVDDRLADDLLGAIGIAQRAQRLVVVDVGGRDGRQHGRLRVAAQVLLEQPGEHRVAVRYELGLFRFSATRTTTRTTATASAARNRRECGRGGAESAASQVVGGRAHGRGVQSSGGRMCAAAARVVLGKGRYDLAESGERLVDVGALLEACALGARRVGALAARQVHQADLAHALGVQLGVRVASLLRQYEREDGVRAATRLVHVRGGHRARLVSIIVQKQNRFEQQQQNREKYSCVLVFTLLPSSMSRSMSM